MQKSIAWIVKCKREHGKNKLVILSFEWSYRKKLLYVFLYNSIIRCLPLPLCSSFYVPRSEHEKLHYFSNINTADYFIWPCLVLKDYFSRISFIIYNRSRWQSLEQWLGRSAPGNKAHCASYSIWCHPVLHVGKYIHIYTNNAAGHLWERKVKQQVVQPKKWWWHFQQDTSQFTSPCDYLHRGGTNCWRRDHRLKWEFDDGTVRNLLTTFL